MYILGGVVLYFKTYCNIVAIDAYLYTNNSQKHHVMINKIGYFTLMILLGVLITGCGKDDPIIPNEEELITTVNYILSPIGGGDVVTLSFKDLDGDGGDAPVITGGILAATKSYTGLLVLLNESETPTENITMEIEEEDEDHQFFFQSTVANLNVTYTDQDGDGNPVGLTSSLSTGAAASGNLTITLRHQPNKSASGVSDGNIANAGGETDIEIVFPINVQ